LKDAYFRHALTGATSWSGTDGKHAVLAVALSPLAVDLNSGETQNFAAGDVILLEDVLLPGHKMRPLHTSHGVSLLFLTLPEQHTRTGKDSVSLPPALFKRRTDPCPGEHPEGSAEVGSTSNRLTRVDTTSSLGSIDADSLMSPGNTFWWTSRQVRRLALAVVGMSLSTLAADFLGKTAPLWLAVGVGGTCFVGGGTWAFTALGDALWTAVQVGMEKRKLHTNDDHDEDDVTSASATTSSDDEQLGEKTAPSKPL